VAATASALTAAVSRRWIRRRIQGYTGDTLGAIEQLCEWAILLALAAGTGRAWDA
jgi:adenosylcobinamide-GDP ribazoletransferase